MPCLFHLSKTCQVILLPVVLQKVTSCLSLGAGTQVCRYLFDISLTFYPDSLRTECMPATLCNCKKCGKIFQRHAAELCADCIKQEEEQFTLLYRTLQESAVTDGIAIEALSS